MLALKISERELCFRKFIVSLSDAMKPPSDARPSCQFHGLAVGKPRIKTLLKSKGVAQATP